MNLHIPQADLLKVLFQLLQNLAVIYTIFTLFLLKYNSNGLDRRQRCNGFNLPGMIVFSLLAASTILLNVPIADSQSIVLDLRLAVLTLAGIYLGPLNSLTVAVFTILLRFLIGGIGWAWWAAGALLYGPCAFWLSRVLPAGRLNAPAAALINSVRFMIILGIQSSIGNFAFLPPVDMELLLQLAILQAVIVPPATFLLDLGLKNALTFHQDYLVLEEKANIDGMTGLINHRRFQEILSAFLPTVSPTAPASILMLDIDFFKIYNDTFGHQSGDLILKEISVIFANTVRSGDVVARYGGEEFIVLMPNASASAAMAVAERIRSTVETHPFAGREKMPAGKLTVSIGVAVFPLDASNKNTLIDLADKALYVAKKAGRNRVEYKPANGEIYSQG